MKEKKQINYRKYFLTVSMLFILLLIFFIFLIAKKEIKSTTNISRDHNNSFALTSPILDCENNIQGEESVISLKSLDEKIKQLKEKYSNEYISLYFRDLNNGPWLGINEKEVFSPASLLKVPVLMAFLREAEDEPSLLKKKIIVSDSDINKVIHQNIVFSNLLSVGGEYNLLEVAESMIQKSDNTGVPILLRNTNSDYISNVFKSVGVPYQDTRTEVVVRVKDYAGFFRVLFNASYLNREMSEKALEILTHSEYKNGIVFGVPENIKVAHKFGERSLDGETDNIQLHDCGIVYYPGKPYIICVMTRGNDFQNQEKIIQELSSYIYNEVDKKN
jgi:beta-lactamase class A